MNEISLGDHTRLFINALKSLIEPKLLNSSVPQNVLIILKKKKKSPLVQQLLIYSYTDRSSLLSSTTLFNDSFHFHSRHSKARTLYWN